MTKFQHKVYDILKGKFLIENDAYKNWGFIIFLLVLSLIMITSSHKIDMKVQKIGKLIRQNKELRSEFVATRSRLMKMKMESTVVKKIKEAGLFPSENPPTKIIVKLN